MWGVDGSIDDHIRDMGLHCYGGNIHPNGGLSYHVYNDDKSFDAYLSTEEWLDIRNIYKQWKTNYRKNKIIKIENGRKS